MKTFEVVTRGNQEFTIKAASFQVLDKFVAFYDQGGALSSLISDVFSVQCHPTHDEMPMDGSNCTIEQIDEVFQQEVDEDAVNVDPISEEQKKTPAVAEWRRVVNLEAKNRRISFDQAARLVNASSPALYGAMLMETGATMEEALRMMQDARLAFAVRDTAKHVRKQC